MLAQKYGVRTLPIVQRGPPHPQIARSLLCQSRQYSAKDVKDVAILGGGITGLATAHNVAREFPAAKVTIYEAAPRIGGWLLSKRVDVPGGSIVFEQGPRTLRPTGGLTTTQLVGAHTLACVILAAKLISLFVLQIQELGLTDDIIFSSKTSPAALNRFVYYPDHLVQLPALSKDSKYAQIFTSIISEPLLRSALWPFLFEAFMDKRSDDLQDESVGSFVSRRLSPTFANNFLSAVIHGIYAGDIWKLSMKSIFPSLWYLEGKFDSIIKALLYCWNQDLKLVNVQDLKLAGSIPFSQFDSKLQASLRNSAVYTFKDGFGQLVDRLAESLEQNPNVIKRTDTEISTIRQDAEKQIEVGLPDQNKAYHSHMISTISASKLSALAHRPSSDISSKPSSFDPKTSYLPSLSGSYATTVQVVSLYYSDPHLIPYTGFGYLIPQAVPFEQNPERALGVIFDSSYGGTPPSTSPDLHVSQTSAQTPSLAQDTVSGTKLSVMLGGHWWDDYSYYPSEQEGLELAMSVLHRHLGVTVAPTAYNVALQKNCIPQYIVGHSARMRAAHGELTRAYKGRLRVAGSWYTGVGVNDCVKAAWSVARGLKEEVQTGLESFDEDEVSWVLTPNKMRNTESKEGGA